MHSEFHPTSLHIGERGWRLLDFARAFTGPGLLDLASWHGTIEPPHPIRLRVFLEQYVTAGGTPDALAPRGGLTAEHWALGWHRMWAVEWFMEQSVCHGQRGHQGALWVPPAWAPFSFAVSTCIT